MPSASLRETYVQRDYDILSQLTEAEMNDSATRIYLHGFNYPDGWTPGTADLLIRYPDPYPRMQPQVLIPKTMRYEGVVSHALNATEELQDDWIRWCVHPIDWQVWRRSANRKDRFPIIEFIGLIRDSLQSPTKHNPTVHAQRQR